MTAKSKVAEERTAAAKAKEQRARDAALAMREYQLEKLAVAARTERLRALRLSQTGQTSNEHRHKSGAKTKKAAPVEAIKEGMG